MEIFNLQESYVETTLEEQLLKRVEICKCDRCRADMMVYALNRLPPRYVSKPRGRTFSRIEISDTQGRASILTSVLSAIKLVSQSPNHLNSNKL